VRYPPIPLPKSNRSSERGPRNSAVRIGSATAALNRLRHRSAPCGSLLPPLIVRTRQLVTELPTCAVLRLVAISRQRQQRACWRRLSVDKCLCAVGGFEIGVQAENRLGTRCQPCGGLRCDDHYRRGGSHRLHKHVRERGPGQPEPHPQRPLPLPPGSRMATGAAAPARPLPAMSSRQRAPCQYMISMMAPTRIHPRRCDPRGPSGGCGSSVRSSQSSRHGASGQHGHHNRRADERRSPTGRAYISTRRANRPMMEAIRNLIRCRPQSQTHCPVGITKCTPSRYPARR